MSQFAQESFAIELKSCLASHNIKTAVIVDDAAQRILRDDLWIQLIEAIRDEDEELLDDLDHLLSDEDVTLSDSISPPIEHHGAIFELLNSSKSDRVKVILSGSCFGETALDSLYGHLVALGLDVVAHFSTENVPRDHSLYFVDFDIEDTAGNAGQRAQLFLTLVTAEQKSKGKCPAVVLMSRLNRGDRDVTAITDAAHVVRFCFRFFNKEVLAQSVEHLSYELLELFETYPLATLYIQHVDALRESVTAAADKVTNDLLRLTPSDFATFASKKLGGEGDSMRHLHYLFNGLLESSLRESDAVHTSFNNFSVTLANTPIRAMTEGGFVLDELHAKLLYDQSPFALASPLTFGDILIEGSIDREIFLLVLTPECDLEIRTGGCPKAETVLLLEGARTTQRKKKESYLAYSPLLGSSDGKRIQWIEWNLRRTRSIEIGLLYSGINTSGGVYRRWARMRHDFAEQLQQRFATDILEVGTEEILSGFSMREAEIYGGIKAANPLGTVTVCEMQVGDDDELWALGENVHNLISALKNSGSSSTDLRRFRSFMGKKDLKGQLKQMKVQTFEQKEALAFVIIDDLNQWTKPEKWKGASS